MPGSEYRVPSGRKPVSRFEELLVWQKSKVLCVSVYRVTNSGPFAKDFGLRSQIQRASVSVMSNIAEGFDRNSRAEFARFLAIARGSAGEVRSQLYLAQELGYIDSTTARAVLRDCNEITSMLIGLRKTLGA
ncbi:MAG TPA: four helix bundle protein [Longimicrobium sp.]|uniref:four helix bundle protein n=1 Tax=Longimicrobium sp. TaxID=2029185 RepID=UPI002EDB968D